MAGEPQSFGVKKARDYSIDLIRIFSILYVVCWRHFMQYPRPSLRYGLSGFENCLSLGALGALAIVSGYIMTQRYEFVRFSDVLLFYRKRVLRVVPMLGVSLLLMLFVGYMKWGQWRVALFGLAGISAYFPPQPMTVWYVSLLMAFYIITPLLSVVLSRSVRGYWALCGAIFFGFVVYGLVHAMDTRVLTFFPLYCLGVYFSSTPGIAHVFRLVWVRCACVGLFALAFVFMGDGVRTSEIYSLNAKTWSTVLVNALVALAGSLMVVSLAQWISVGFGRLRVVSFGAYVSFGLYLFHRPVYHVMAKWLPEEPVNQLTYMWLVAFPMLVVVAYLIQKSMDWLLARISE